VDILVAEVLEATKEVCITASANLVADPSLIAAATSSEVTKLAPFNASLLAAEAVST